MASVCPPILKVDCQKHHIDPEMLDSEIRTCVKMNIVYCSRCSNVLDYVLFECEARERIKWSRTVASNRRKIKNAKSKKNHSTKHHENHEITAKINVQELNINFLEITGFSNRQYDVICQQRF